MGYVVAAKLTARVSVSINQPRISIAALGKRELRVVVAPLNGNCCYDAGLRGCKRGFANESDLLGHRVSGYIVILLNYSFLSYASFYFTLIVARNKSFKFSNESFKSDFFFFFFFANRKNAAPRNRNRNFKFSLWFLFSSD